MSLTFKRVRNLNFFHRNLVDKFLVCQVRELIDAQLETDAGVVLSDLPEVVTEDIKSLFVVVDRGVGFSIPCTEPNEGQIILVGKILNRQCS